MYSDVYGGEIDNINQLESITFTGIELKEFIEKINELNPRKINVNQVKFDSFLEGYKTAAENLLASYDEIKGHKL